MHDEGARSSTKIFANIFIAFIGAGILGLPYAFKEAGIIEGVLILATVAIISVKAMLMLIDCKLKLTSQHCPHLLLSNGQAAPEEKESLEKNGVHIDVKNEVVINHDLDYSDVGYYAMGGVGKFVVDSSIFVSQTGFSCAYLIFIMRNIEDIVGILSSYQYLATLLPPLVLLVNLRHLKHLATFSIFADFANIFAYGVVFWFDFAHFNRVSLHRRTFSADGLPFFLSIAVYCYEGAGMILALESSCAKDMRGHFRSLFKLALFFTTLLYIFFGVCGYLSFGPETNEIITLNLPAGVFPAIVKLCLCFSLFFTYPVMMFPVVKILESKLILDPKTNYYYGLILRCVTVITTGIIVVVIPDFSTLMALVGAGCCTLLAFILPALFHLRIFKGNLTKFQMCIDIMILVFGVAMTVLGLRDALMRVFSSGQSPNVPL